MNPAKNWIDMMNEMDLIITASEFNKRIFSTNGANIPIEVIPHTFDPKLFNKDVQHKGRYDLFTFLSMGSWKQRKNFEALIKGFYDAFEAKDGVCLLIKTDKPESLSETVQRIKRTGEWRSKETAPIFADISKKCPFEDIPSIMKKGDVYVSPSLGEGFNLVGLHAMALGIPILVTRFGGTLEYAKPEFSTYIEPTHYKTYPTMDGIPQFRNCIWPVIKIREIRDKLRYAKENYHHLREKSLLGYKFVHDKFAYSTIGNKFLEVLE